MYPVIVANLGLKIPGVEFAIAKILFINSSSIFTLNQVANDLHNHAKIGINTCPPPKTDKEINVIITRETRRAKIIS
ncbi:Uncharacterised protein [Mycoplasma putrefaciens]|nr:Uncharacterised protein [Mycoplasma putrefaciens]